MKRKTFKSILIKKLIFWLMGSVILLALITVALNMYLWILTETFFFEYRNTVVTRIYSQYADLSGQNLSEKEIYEQLELRTATLISSDDDMFSTATIVYDADTGERVMDSEKKGIIIMGSNDETPSTSFYWCPPEILAEYDKEYDKCLREGIDVTVKTREVYIQDSICIPGAVDLVYASGKKEGEIYKSFDFTPANTDEYVRYDVTDEGVTVMGPFIGGNKKDSKIMSMLEAHISEYMSDDMLYGDQTTFVETLFCFENYGQTELNISKDKKLIVLTATVTDVWGNYKHFIINAYIAVMLLAVVFAILTARIKYLKLRSGYDMEDYRRTMTNSMAHDLKSPLMAISGYAENLKANVHTEKRDYYAESIIDNVDYMNSIISNILELSRVETKRIKLNKTKLNIKELIEEALKKYSEWIEEKELNILIQGEGEFLGDRQLMLQAMDNLIGNAVKYTTEKGDIHVEISPKRIVIANTCKDEIGTKAHNLWKPFVKGDNSRSNKKGSGIGLTIAKHIFEMHKFKMNISYKDNEFLVSVTI